MTRPDPSRIVMAHSLPWYEHHDGEWRLDIPGIPVFINRTEEGLWEVDLMKLQHAFSDKYFVAKIVGYTLDQAMALSVSVAIDEAEGAVRDAEGNLREARDNRSMLNDYLKERSL